MILGCGDFFYLIGVSMPDFTSKRALVVDDEPDLREITVLELENYGCEVAEAENGRVAIDMIAEGKFDFIISDIRMPEGNGIDLLDAVVGMQAAKPLVFLVTGFADITREEAIARGASEMYFKPVDWGDMLDEISEKVGERKKEAKVG